MFVPSGMFARGSVFPSCAGAVLPAAMMSPTAMFSVAGRSVSSPSS